MSVAATQQRSLLDGAVTDLTIITGQKPMVTKAKKSIASFKLREGNEIGAKVTCRGDRMSEFYDRLVSLAIPPIRDFRGMSPTQFDGHGNYTFGLTEQLVFPEIDYDNIDSVRGMDITIVTTAQTDEHGRALFAARWASRSAEMGSRGKPHGEESSDQQAAGHAEVQGARLRRAAGVAAGRAGCTATSGCADRLAQIGACRRSPRRDEVVVVRGVAAK